MSKLLLHFKSELDEGRARSRYGRLGQQHFSIRARSRSLGRQRRGVSQTIAHSATNLKCTAIQRHPTKLTNPGASDRREAPTALRDQKAERQCDHTSELSLTIHG
jgi:hypothetical protein